MKPEKFKKLVDSAIVTIRSKLNPGERFAFSAEALMAWMQIDRSVASQIVTQLKKDQFLHTKDAYAGDPNDSANRGKRAFLVKKTEP